jgi:hypothetical protein
MQAKEYISVSIKLLPLSVTGLGNSPFKVPWTYIGNCDIIVQALALTTLDMERDGRW